MTIEPTNPVATPAVTVAALLADLAMTRGAASPEEGNALHPHGPDDGRLLDLEDHLADLLGWRRPETPAEALAVVVVAYTQLDIEHCTDDPPKKARVERAFRLVYMALPVLARAIDADGIPGSIVRHFGAPAILEAST